jgi:hypothetical protein
MPCAADKVFSCELQRAPLLQIRPDDASFFIWCEEAKANDRIELGRSI